MNDLVSLDDVFNDEAPKEPEVTGEVETPEPPEPAETPKPEEEQETAQDSPPESEKPAEDEESWTKTAVLDERRKRQELERQLEELRAKQDPKEEDNRPDVFEDPDGAFGHLEKSFDQKLLNERINLSRSFMEDIKEDYSDKESVFVEMAKDNPELIRQMQAHPHPAKFAYEQASKHLEFKEMQDVDAYKNKIREELKAEILKELEDKDTQKAEKDKIIESPSLAKTRSAKDEPVTEETLEDFVPLGVG